MSEKIIIYGISNAGLRVAEFLKDTGPDVVVALPEASPFVRKLEDRNIRLVHSDLSNFDLLRDLDLHLAKSIILTSDDELFNIQAALHAIEINPAIRVVIRLFNLNLASRLQDSIRNFRVLSVSQVSSPVFAASALLEKPLLSYKSEDNIFSFYETSGELFSGRTINDIESEKEAKVISVNNAFFPDMSWKIRPEDRLTLFSDCSFAKGLSGIRTSGKYTVRTKSKKQCGKKFLLSLMRIDRILLNTVLSLIAIVIFCVVYFRFSENLSLINALYFVITVLTTVGFGDISLKDSSDLSKVVGMVLMLSGVTLFAILFAIVTDSLIKKRIDLLLGRKQTRLKGHVILCGLGDVGIRILEDLILLKEKVIVIERNQDNRFIQTVRDRGVPFIIADATLEETLVEANIRDAKSVICATDDDMKNLETGLNARALNKSIRVVLRIFDREFAEKLEKYFDIHVALSSSHMASPAFASAALDTGVINILNVGDENIFLKEREFDNEDVFYGLISNRDVKPLVILKNDGTVMFNMNDYCFQKGDRLFYLTKEL